MVARGFDDPGLVAGLVEKIASLDFKRAKLMEVCGTHTVSLAKHGIRSLLPKGVTIVSGPGCPVCVTSNSDLSLAFQAARSSGVTLVTFGDMMRVPVNGMSLQGLRAEGADIRVVYSPTDALSIPNDKEVVFFGVGFETTSPGVAALLRIAEQRGIGNLSIISCFKLIPPALRSLLEGGEVRVNGLILPGHVSTIIGVRPYRFIVDEFHVPCVIAGFEPVDLLTAIYVLLKMLRDGRADLVNAYTRSVTPDGNQEAGRLLREYFEPTEAEWRGIGSIPYSGLALREAHSHLDARLKLGLEPMSVPDAPGCRCAEVIRGSLLPTGCPLFSTKCTPESPLGPCMVTSEGTCAAYYNYG